jgi:addiction module HigA family antidote
MTRPAIHPGEVLADELAELEMSAVAFSREVHVPTNRVTQILRGQRGITADTALRFGYYLGTGPELWLNLQRSYDLRLAEGTIGEQIRAEITPRQQMG